MKRKPLSMKRLTILSAHYCIEMGEKKGMAEVKRLMKFLDYVWKHKDDNLESLPTPFTKKP